MNHPIPTITLALALALTACQEKSQAPPTSTTARNNSATPESTSKTPPKKKAKEARAALKKKIEKTPNSSTENKSSLNAQESLETMSWPTIIHVKLIAEAVDCLGVNEPDAKKQASEMALLLSKYNMTRAQYDHRLKLLLQDQTFKDGLIKAHKTCRMSRDKLLDFLADRACVKNAYTKAGFDEVPRPYSPSHIYRGQFTEDFQFVERRYRKEPSFDEALKTRISKCPDYDLKQLRNRNGDLCQKDEHCLSGLKCYSGATPPECRSEKEIESLNKEVANNQAKAHECDSQPACKQFGLCTDSGGKCVPNVKSCLTAQVCEDEGLCQSSGTACVAHSHMACAESKACKTERECVRRGEACVQGTASDCKESHECKINGECSLVENRCVAAKRDDCTESANCANSGECTLKDGGCIADSDKDCAQSTGCKKFGRCTARDGWCGK